MGSKKVILEGEEEVKENNTGRGQGVHISQTRVDGTMSWRGNFCKRGSIPSYMHACLTDALVSKCKSMDFLNLLVIVNKRCVGGGALALNC